MEATQLETVNKNTAVAHMTNRDLGVEEVISSDIKIPRALLLQKMSKLVEEEKGKPGQIVGTIEANMLGSETDTFKFVPLYIYNQWTVYESVGNKFVRSEPRTPTNDKQSFEFEENGKAMKRYKSINAFVMAVDELEDGEALPYLISFRSSSFDAGRTLMSIVTKLMMFQKPIYNYVFEVSSQKTTNEKGTFWVFNLQRAKDEKGKGLVLKEGLLELVSHWKKQVTSGRVQVDEEHSESEVNSETTEEKF